MNCDGRSSLPRPLGGISFDDKDAAYPVMVDPLIVSLAWSADANRANANLGNAVATAGDVNGDGFSNISAGAEKYDNGPPNEGRALPDLGFRCPSSPLRLPFRHSGMKTILTSRQ